MKFFPWSIKTFLHNPERIYTKRYHSQSSSTMSSDCITSLLVMLTSGQLLQQAVSLKLNISQSIFKPRWQCHCCFLRLDSNQKSWKHFRKYLAKFIQQAKIQSSEAKRAWNGWTGINTCRESDVLQISQHWASLHLSETILLNVWIYNLSFKMQKGGKK